MRWIVLPLLMSLGAPAAAQDSPWPDEYTDPAAARAEAADLVLPMPCGAAMAFQKVAVPVDAADAMADPLADRRLMLGQALDETGYSDYLRPAFLRGPFAGPGTAGTHYFIARYELTAGQYRALAGDCGEPVRADRLAQGGLSWFDAVDLARRYTEWLHANAPDALPVAGQARAFLRLPTEEEWEYAARGGARIDATRFPDLTFFGQGDMRDFALHQAPGSGRGRLGPVGLRQPNPLGLYDIYGNAEELVLTPYRLNAAGRLHGQAGGIVTRGGSVLSTPDQLFSAQRTEYPPYDGAGAPLRSATFGLRLAISAPVVTSDARLAEIRHRWDELAGAASPQDAPPDPDALLAGLIAAEPDPRRQAALAALQLEFRRARDRTQTARLQSARSTLLAGAVLIGSLGENAALIEAKAANIRMLVSLQRAGSGSTLLERQVQSHARQIERLRNVRSAYLLSYRAALETLSAEIAPAERQTAHDVLREELALSDRPRLLTALDRFWEDLDIYARDPGLGPEALLRMALR
ncbi:MAG: formylglycine-generating enzyme family protein [Jhaorihella sp.]